MNLVIAKWSLANVYHNGKRSLFSYCCSNSCIQKPHCSRLTYCNSTLSFEPKFQIQDSHFWTNKMSFLSFKFIFKCWMVLRGDAQLRVSTFSPFNLFKLFTLTHFVSGLSSYLLYTEIFVCGLQLCKHTPNTHTTLN